MTDWLKMHTTPEAFIWQSFPVEGVPLSTAAETAED
jgi:hypothetical protein